MTSRNGSELHQLVLVATAWRGWELDEVSRRALDRLVRALLGPTAGTSGGAANAWLAVTDDGAVHRDNWLVGDRAQQRMQTFIDRLAAARALDGADRERQITSSRLRVLCGPDRTDAVFPAPDAPPRPSGDPERPRHWTALDVQLVPDRATGRSPRFQIHLGFSFWAVRPPWHPAEAGGTTRPIELSDIPSLRKAFEERAATAARDLVDKHFGPSTTLVWGREHAPPMYWVVTPAMPRKNPSKYLDDPDVAERLVRPLLGRGPMDDGVAASIIDGNVLALRRFRQERGTPEEHGADLDADASVSMDIGMRGGAGASVGAGASGGTDDGAADGGGADGERQVALRPVYLLLPGRARPNGGDRPKDFQHQLAITALTRFEARAAAYMHDIDDELQVWSTHIRVYDSVAEQAGTLWDALALHLPVRTRTALAATHRAIALVHQTLLQGVADLADVESQVMALTTDVDRLSDELADLVAQRLAERPPATAYHGVGESVAQASQLSRLRRHSEAVVADAHRVKGQYEDLLSSIAHAFDERRVRELDVLQRGGHRLSVAVSAVTGVAIIDFLFNIKNSGDLAWAWRYLLGGVAVAFGLVLVYVVIRNFLSVRKAQYITSSNFRKNYDEVLSYLRDSSTRELNRRPPEAEGLRPGAPVRRDERAGHDERDEWAGRDGALATRFAALWDKATRGTPPAGSRRRKPRQDIKRLADDIEQWTLRALLLTERPRKLSRYRLPKLTLLYRHCVALDRARRWETAGALVADADLELTLQEEGYSLVEARELDRHIRARTRALQRTRTKATATMTGAATGASAEPPGTGQLLRDIERVLGSRTPGKDLDHHNRRFVEFAVGRLIARGVRQFIDVGAGLPESDGVHVIAKRAGVADAKVLYVDHASEVVAQAQALLPEEGRTKFLDADMVSQTDKIIHAAQDLFDFGRPMAVLFTRVLGYEPDIRARSTMARFRDQLPAGCYVVVSHVAPGSLGVGGLNRVPTNHDGPHKERIRSRARIRSYLDRLDLEVGLFDAAELPETGLLTADPPAPTSPPPQKIHITGGIARVPLTGPR